MQAEHVFDDRQPEPGTALVARTTGRDTIETFGDARQVLGGNAAAAVLHREAGAAVFIEPAQRDPPAGRGVAHRIGDQIGEGAVQVLGRTAQIARRCRLDQNLVLLLRQGFGITTAPGEEAQVDYGEGPMVRDAGTGQYRRARLFVLTLGYSRKAVRLLTMSSSTQVWAKLHERAFRRLGGAPRVVVLDNLKEGVLRPDIYEPTLNPLYREVLAHYGVVAVPCRIRDPDRKGKVESSVGHAQQTPLRGQRFETLEAAQAYLDRWEAHWADTRIHGTTKRQVAAMFAEEQPALQPLPLEPFRYYRHGLRTVHLDGCVEVEAAYYSVPPGWIGRRVQVQWTDLHVRVLVPTTGELLREHVRTKRGWHRIDDSDRSSRTPATTLA